MFSAQSSSSQQIVALVTGGNRGIGVELVRLLSERHADWIVYMGSRTTERGEAALTALRSTARKSNGGFTSAPHSNVRVIQFDVNSASSIQAATAHLSSTHGRLDLLICNAGVMLRKPPSVAELVMQTNFYSVHDTLLAMDGLLTSAAQPLVVVVSSEVGPWTVHQMRGVARQRVEDAAQTVSWEELTDCAADYCRFLAEPQSAKYAWPSPQSTVYAYGISKALVTTYMRKYAREHPHIQAVCSAPGYCATDMTSGAVGKQRRSAAEGAESVLWAVEHRAEAVSGRQYQDGEVLPVAQARRSRSRSGAGKPRR